MNHSVHRFHNDKLYAKKSPSFQPLRQLAFALNHSRFIVQKFKQKKAPVGWTNQSAQFPFPSLLTSCPFSGVTYTHFTFPYLKSPYKYYPHLAHFPSPVHRSRTTLPLALHSNSCAFLQDPYICLLILCSGLWLNRASMLLLWFWQLWSFWPWQHPLRTPASPQLLLQMPEPGSLCPCPLLWLPDLCSSLFLLCSDIKRLLICEHPGWVAIIILAIHYSTVYVHLIHSLSWNF